MWSIFRRPVQKRQIATAIAGALFGALFAIGALAALTQAMVKAALDLIF